MANIICIANQKGGTGKTTCAVNFASYFAKHGKRTLILDMEPQANATLSLGLDPRFFDKTMYQVLLNECSLKEVIKRDVFRNLDAAPANVLLANTDINLASYPNSQFLLKGHVQKIASEYEYIFIDCPPSISLLVMNAFAAADSVLIPLLADYLSLEGLAQLIRSIKLAKKRLNPHLEILGILFCIVNLKQKIARESIDLVKKNFRDKVFGTNIKACVKLKEAPSHGKSIFDYAPFSIGAFDYGSVARELEERCKRLRMDRARESMLPERWSNPNLSKKSRTDIDV